MRRVRNEKKMITMLTAAFLSTTIFSEGVLAFQQPIYFYDVRGEDAQCEPRADRIGYQYRNVNGVEYRRLYNFTKGIPLGDWERV